MGQPILATEERQLAKLQAVCSPLTSTQTPPQDWCDADRRLAIVGQMRTLYTELRAAKAQAGG
jgi:hypothetical protein